jgi:transposase
MCAMNDDAEIDRVARRLIRQLGARAAEKAAEMVREQGGIGTQTGAMWAKILAKVEELQWKGYKTSGS